MRRAAARSSALVRRKRIRFALVLLAAVSALSVLTVLTTGAVAVDVPAASVRAREAALHITAVDADTGRALAVRARISRVALLGDERVIVTGAGIIETRLPSGSYRIHVTHGPEWSVAERQVELGPGQQARIELALRREVDARAFTGCDLHVHTAESPDSNLQLQQRIETLLAEDVQFAVLTDHNRVTQASEALARAGIASLPGVEVTTWDPELGHFNVFPRVSAPHYKHATAQSLLRELRKTSESFVQINHPRLEGHIGYFALAEFDRTTGKGSARFPLAFDGLEVWNGYDLAAPSRRDEVFRDWLAMVARGQHITATGNSDSHRAGLAPYVGYPRTYVRVPRDRAHLPGKVLTALKQGRAFVTNGPILDLMVGDKGPGDTVHLTRHQQSVIVTVELQAPAWMQLTSLELWLGEEQVRVLPLAPSPRDNRQTLRFALPVGGQRMLLAAVRGDASLKPLVGRSQVTPYAFTNPIWIARP